MATRAERLRTEQARKGPSAKTIKRAEAKKAKQDKLLAPHPTKRAGRKATYALETPQQNGAPSRKSTRSAANRSKPDTNLTLREQRTKNSPVARARKAAAKQIRVRGS